MYTTLQQTYTDIPNYVTANIYGYFKPRCSKHIRIYIWTFTIIASGNESRQQRILLLLFDRQDPRIYFARHWMKDRKPFGIKTTSSGKPFEWNYIPTYNETYSTMRGTVPKTRVIFNYIPTSNKGGGPFWRHRFGAADSAPCRFSAG